MALSYSIAARHPDTFLGKRIRYAGLLPTTVLVFLFAANIYDAGGAFGVKYVAFLVACVFSLWTLKYLDLSPSEIVTGLLLFLAWPTLSLLYGAARGGDMLIGLTQVTPFLFAFVLALILPSFDNRLPFRLFYACVFSLAIVVIASFTLVFLLPDNSISQKVFETLTNLHEREGYFGTQSMGDVDVPIFYFRSTLFLVPACVYYLFIEKMLRAGLIFLAICLTWSKSGILIALAFGLVYSVLTLASHPAASGGYAFWAKRRVLSRAVLPMAMLVGVTSLIMMSFPVFSEFLRDTLAGESETAMLRKGHVQSVMELFAENPHYLLVGQGVGVPFFSSGASDYVQSIEVDHLNTIRKFGLPWFLAFSFVVFFSAWKLIKGKQIEMRAFGFALISMYLAAGTNPVFMSPLFLILTTLCYFAQRPVHGKAS